MKLHTEDYSSVKGFASLMYEGDVLVGIGISGTPGATSDWWLKAKEGFMGVGEIRRTQLDALQGLEDFTKLSYKDLYSAVRELFPIESQVKTC